MMRGGRHDAQTDYGDDRVRKSAVFSGVCRDVNCHQLMMRFSFERVDISSSIVTLIASSTLNVVIAIAAALPAIRTINHSVTK